MSTQATSAVALESDRIDEVAGRLVKALAPRAIYLFGSHVYGSPSGDSDVDILVLLDDALLSRPDLDERGYRALRGMFLPIELHIHGERRFLECGREPGSFEHEVLSRGRLLYANS